MRRCVAEVNPGVCGFNARIEATSEDEQNVSFAIASECNNIRSLAGRLGTVDAYREIGDGFDGVVHTAVRESLRGCCSGCIVPSGIFKAMQVAARVALPADAGVSMSAE